MANTLNLGNGQWATKEGSLLGYNSENNNYKPLPFDFSRASTATRVNKQGLIETVGADQPRIDYLNNTKGALLLEPSRTNYLLQSNQFDTTWTTSNATVTGGQTGVGGSTDAWLLTASGTSNCRINQSVSGSGVQSISIYAKANTSNFLSINTIVSGTNALAYFDLSKGIIGDTNSAVIDANIQNVGEGWYRCSFIYNDTNTQIRFLVVDANGSIDVTSGNSIYIQYSQLESDSYPTSYIPTQGSTVTRLADVCNNGGNEQVINSTEGVLYAEISALANDLSQRHISVSNGSDSDVVRIHYHTISNSIRGQVRRGGAIQASLTHIVPDIKDFHKVAISYKENDVKLYVDGVLVLTDTSASMPTGLAELAFDNGNGVNLFFGNVKDVRVYNTALTEQELQNLTS
jgi:hypothetical protein